MNSSSTIIVNPPSFLEQSKHYLTAGLAVSLIVTIVASAALPIIYFLSLNIPHVYLSIPITTVGFSSTAFLIFLVLQLIRCRKKDKTEKKIEENLQSTPIIATSPESSTPSKKINFTVSKSMDSAVSSKVIDTKEESIAIRYYDRETNEVKEEKIYGERILRYLYQKKGVVPKSIKYVAARASFTSSIYGFWQRRTWSAKKIARFVEEYEIDTNEFADSISSFTCFNDFFTRKLKPTARPIAKSDAVMPADARYLVFPDIKKNSKFIVKNQSFCLTKLLNDQMLAEEYEGGSLVIARLCPTDYHRFHFPFESTPTTRKSIKGRYHSVSPIAVRERVDIFTENKREITVLSKTPFGDVLYLEVGATNVGTIHQTYQGKNAYEKGEEKGYFSFGGSTIILVFKRDTILFDNDLLDHSILDMETYCKMGTSLGTAVNEM